MWSLVEEYVLAERSAVSKDAGQLESDDDRLTSFEMLVAQAWKGAVSMPKDAPVPSPGTHFFYDLGGDSMSALRAVKKLRDGLNIPDEGSILQRAREAYGIYSGAFSPSLISRYPQLRAYAAAIRNETPTASASKVRISTLHDALRVACLHATDDPNCPYMLVIRSLFELNRLGSQVLPDGDVTKSSRGFAPLHAACRSKCLPAVKYLLCAGAYHTMPSAEGMTPAHYACEGAGTKTQIDVLKTLIEAGASPIVITKAGQNLLHFAARAGNVPLLRYLMTHPTIVKVGIGMKDRWSRTPVEWAIINGHYEAFSYLFGPVSAAARKTKLIKNKHLKSTHLRYEAPIHIAARLYTDDDRYIRFIVKMGNAREVLSLLDGDKRTVIHSAVEGIATKRSGLESPDEKLVLEHYRVLGAVLETCKASGVAESVISTQDSSGLVAAAYAASVGCSVACAMIKDTGFDGDSFGPRARKRYTNASGERLALPSGRRIRSSGKQKREMLKAKRKGKMIRVDTEDATIKDTLHMLKVQRRKDAATMSKSKQEPAPKAVADAALSSLKKELRIVKETAFVSKTGKTKAKHSNDDDVDMWICGIEA